MQKTDLTHSRALPPDRTETQYLSLDFRRSGSQADEGIGRFNSSVRDGRAQTQALLNYQRNRKNAITLNNLKLIVVLSFIPLISIGYTLVQPTWYMIGRDNFYDYYVNPLSIALFATKQLQEYKTHFLWNFQSNGCNHNLRLCSTITNFVIAGLISSMIILVAMAMHFFTILQLTMMIRVRYKRMIKCMSPLKIQLLVLFFYIAALVYWYFASGLFTDIGDIKRFLGNTGKILILYLIAIFSKIIILAYLRWVLSKGRKNALVNKLLYAEQALIREITDEGSTSEDNNAIN